MSSSSIPLIKLLISFLPEFKFSREEDWLISLLNINRLDLINFEVKFCLLSLVRINESSIDLVSLFLITEFLETKKKQLQILITFLQISLLKKFLVP